jgi:uncharacterized protein YciI
MPRIRARRVLVVFNAGPAWTSGPPEQQADWDAHSDFIDDLIERGHFVMGGPIADNSGSITVLENVAGADEARALLDADPFLANGVFEWSDVREWNVYVDELSARSSST